MFRNLTVAVLVSYCAVAVAQDAASVFTKAKNSVYVVRAQLSGTNAQGSAVRISGSSVVTNCHVVQGATSVVVYAGASDFAAEVLHSDPARDLCTLQVPNLPPSETPAIRRLDTIRVGEHVVALGAPRGFELTLSEGIVAALRETESGRIIQTTTPISPGSSGGALFDMQGRLVGITSFQRRDSQNLNFAAPAEWIAEIPKRHAVVPVAKPKLEHRIVKLVCRGVVTSNNFLVTSTMGANEWRRTVEAEIDLSVPSVRLSSFMPAVLSQRYPIFLDRSLKALEPYALMELGDALRHFDSVELDTPQGRRIVSVSIVINRKTSEMTLEESDLDPRPLMRELKKNLVTYERGEYQCEQDKGRQF